MNKERHIGMTYANDYNITKKINDPHFKDLNKISENTYEVFSSKRKIKMDVPIQVGCAVYDLAKLRMLEFYMISLISILTALTLYIVKWIQIARILPSVVKILKI